MTAPATILMYHRVGEPGVDPWRLCVTPERFAQQLDTLRTLAQPVTLRALLDGAADHLARPVVVTFDDGYADNLEIAAPYLRHFEVPATVFITSDAIGSRAEFWWDELERVLLNPGVLPAAFEIKLAGNAHRWALGDTANYDAVRWQRERHWSLLRSDPPPSARHVLYTEFWSLLRPLAVADRENALEVFRAWHGRPAVVRSTHRTLTVDELRALDAQVRIEIGAHTKTHPILSERPLDEQRHEIHACKIRLEQLIERPVVNFSYPYGAHTDDTAALVRDAGFRSACTTRPGVVQAGRDLFRLPRIQAEDWTGEALAARLSEGFPVAP